MRCYRRQRRNMSRYDDIDFDLLWDTITTDLPPLIEALQVIVGDA